MGSRGIPARYGGYETLMEELSRRLAERGWEVTVYCRSHYTPRSLRALGGAAGGAADGAHQAPRHAGAHPAVVPARRVPALRRRAGGQRRERLFVPLLRAAGIPTALHVDGLEQARAKWGAFGRWVYASPSGSPAPAHALVTDAEVIRRHYEQRYGADLVDDPYGVEPRPPEGREVLERLGLAPRGYFLYVSRFEPENNPHRVVEAYREGPAASCRW
jgi:glycosyltransferase involved in cell wall biosynthesis